MSERRSKYGARRTEIDGYQFDSMAEAKRYRELCLFVKSGLISDLQVHPRFEIVPKDRHGRALYYEADFMYININNGGELPTVEDVKGVRTAVYNLKRRLFLARYPGFQFVEIGIEHG